MKEHLLTYEDCLKLVNVYNNFNFSVKDYIIDGFKVTTFNYFLCDYSHFNQPLKNEPDITGYDMRGITFVFNKDGSLYKRFFMLRKFFNINQIEETQYNLIKNKKIKYVTSKEDGSLIAFIHLPNGHIFAKTLAGFDNDQVKNSMKIYHNDKDLQKFIKYCLIINHTPLFEYVSFDNRIVLKYSKPELRFIGSRNNLTGEFKSAIWTFSDNYNINNIKCVSSLENVTIDELIEKAKTEENKEGWVVEFEDGQMIKIKTRHYCNLHFIRTENIFRENEIIKYYFNQTLDDILGQLDPETDIDAFKFVDKVKNAIINRSNYIDEKVNKLQNLYSDNWDDFAKNHYKEPFFDLFRIKVSKPEDYNRRKIEYILKETYKLNNARQIVEKWSKN